MARTRYGLLYGACLCALAGGASAQDAEQAAVPEPAQAAQSSPGAIEEIVVTALRRSESLQDVPVSISALTGAALDRQGLSQVGDLAGVVPNLQASTVGGDGLPIFSLRGVSMTDYSFNQQGPVATYFDEAYKGSWPLLPVDMYDLERVEVLRGPQGTLYGKNTTGGAINFISRKPGFDTEGYLQLGYGNYQRWDAEGAAQLPLGDRFAARVAFTYSRADGWFENLLPGEPDASAVRQYGVRATLLFKANDDLDFLLRLSTSLQNPMNVGNYTKPGPLGVGGGVYEMVGGSSYFRTGIGRRQIESDGIEPFDHRTRGATLTANWRASDTLTVTSVTSYDYGDVSFPEDADGSPLQVVAAEYQGEVDQFSQDLRLASNFDGGLNFIIGAYYSDESGDLGNRLTYYGDVDLTGDGAVSVDDCLQTFVVACSYRNDFRQERTTKAIYGDANHELSDRVTLRGGLRYTWDEGDIPAYTAQLFAADGTPIANTIPGDPDDFEASTSGHFSKGMATGKIGIDFKTANGHLLYASFSRGYRASAFNAQAYINPLELNVADPETVNAYEIGFKSQFLNRAVTFNGAAFMYDYKNQQALNVDSSTLVQTMLNVPKSQIVGGELELTVYPADALRFNLGLGLLDTKVEEGVVSGVQIDGNRLPNAPELSASAGFDWDVVDGASGKLTLGLNGTYTSRQYFDLFNTERMAQGGYALLNAQLSYRSADDRFGVGLWGKNVLDKFYARYAIDLSGFGYDYFRLGDPPTWGITVDARF